MRLTRKQSRKRDQLLEDADILIARAEDHEIKSRQAMATAGELRGKAAECKEQAGLPS